MTNTESEQFLMFPEEKQPTNEAFSPDSERLMENISFLKRGFSLIREKLDKAMKFGGAMAVKDFLNCTNRDIEYIQIAINEEFYFPILGLRKKDSSDNVFVSRLIDSLAADIKTDILEMALKVYDIDPLLVPLFFGIPIKECEKLRDIYPSEFYEFAKNSDWIPTVQPFLQLIRLEGMEYFRFLSHLLYRKSATELIPLDMPSISNFHILYNAKNAGVRKPQLNFHKIATLNDAAFMMSQGLDRTLIAQATNIWTLRLRSETEEELPKRRNMEDLKFKKLSSEAPYRIYLNLYNYLSSSKDNEPIDFRRTAVAYQIISQLFEASDCWKHQEVSAVSYTLCYSAALYQTFNWVFGKSYQNVYNRCSVNNLSYKKFVRLRPGPYHAWFSELVHCDKCNNNFVACNVFGLRKACPICGAKLTI